MTANTEVFDEAELAEKLEQFERENGVNAVRSKVFQGTKEEAEKLVDPNKECVECGILIPVERQRANPTAKFCVDCQEYFDEQAERKRKLTGTYSGLGIFG
jgi:RNA polymerase-binding transcription factor DksA